MSRPSISQEETVLSLIKDIVNGEAWAESRVGWSEYSAESVCKWDGIHCDKYDAVAMISLPAQNITLNVLPSEIGRLTKLTLLDLKDNSIGITNSTINTTSSNTIIPAEIARLPALEILDLSGTGIGGCIPTFTSSQLREIRLASNNLNGTLPPDFGKELHKLEKLDLSHNHITGSLSSSIGKMTKLLYLDLSDNSFQGSIPEDLGNLSELQGLFLDHNKFLGHIPPAISRIQKLYQLFIHKNDFSGTLPAALADLPYLLDLYVDGNKFTGTVPQELCDRYLNKDFFEGQTGASERNGCNSIACPSGTEAHEGIFPCSDCAKSYYNPYIGNNKCIDLDQRDILRKIYESLDGASWVNSPTWQMAEAGQWASNIDVCDLQGIECNQTGHVVNITLSNLNLGGTIPDEVGFLKFLRVFNVSDNNIGGYVPSDLRYAPLEVLDISNNLIEGFIPPMLCQKSEINGNGNYGESSCDFLACPVGMFSVTGRGDANRKDKNCEPCYDGNPYLGRKTCDAVSNPKSSYSSDLSKGDYFIVIASFFAALLVLGTIAVIVSRRRRRQKSSYYNDDRPRVRVFSERSLKNYRDRDNQTSDSAAERAMKEKDLWLDVPKIV